MDATWTEIELNEEPTTTEICKTLVRIRRNIRSENRMEDGESRTVWIADERQVSRAEYERTEWISRTEVEISQLDQDEAVAEIADLLLGGGGA